MRAYALIIITLALFVLAGCATRMPAAIDTRIAEPPPDIAAVRANPDSYRGEAVRWGGTIAGTENQADSTLIEIVARELDSNGRPADTDTSTGRFLAVVDGFLDPAIYERGRSITVVGELAGVESRKVGDYDYPYPRVRVRGHHLWEPRPDPAAAYPGPWYWHDPWYGPWYRDPWFPHHHPYHHW